MVVGPNPEEFLESLTPGIRARVEALQVCVLYVHCLGADNAWQEGATPPPAPPKQRAAVAASIQWAVLAAERSCCWTQQQLTLGGGAALRGLPQLMLWLVHSGVQKEQVSGAECFRQSVLGNAWLFVDMFVQHAMVTSTLSWCWRVPQHDLLCIPTWQLRQFAELALCFVCMHVVFVSTGSAG